MLKDPIFHEYRISWGWAKGATAKKQRVTFEKMNSPDKLVGATVANALSGNAFHPLKKKQGRQLMESPVFPSQGFT